MGLGGISIWQLLIVLAIVIMLFGTKRLRTLGSDLGSAVKGFRKSMQEEEDKSEESAKLEADAGEPLDKGEAATAQQKRQDAEQ